MGNSNKVSPKRIEASRRNGAKSRGPKTAQGMLHSTMSRYRHGFYAKPDTQTRALMIEIGEDPDLVTRLERRLISAWEPADAMQELLVADLARLYAKKEFCLKVSIHNRADEVRRANQRNSSLSIKDITDREFPIDEDLLKDVGYRGVPSTTESLNVSMSILNRLLRAVKAQDWDSKSALLEDVGTLYGQRLQGCGKSIDALLRQLTGEVAPGFSPATPGSHEAGDDSNSADAPNVAPGFSPAGEGKDDPDGQQLPPDQAPDRAPDQAEILSVQLVRQLCEEIFRVETESFNYGLKQGDILRDDTFSDSLPGSVNWGRAILQEAILDREIERKVRLMVRLKWLERWGQVSRQSGGGAQPIEEAELRMAEPNKEGDRGAN